MNLSEFGKRQSQEMVKLVDEARALAHDRLQSAGDVTEGAQLGGHDLDRRGPFAEGIASGSASLNRIGLLGAEERGAIVFVALRIAAGDEEGGVFERGRVSAPRAELMQEVQQVVGILSGSVESDDEVNAVELGGNLFETSAELTIADGGLDEREFGCSGL